MLKLINEKDIYDKIYQKMPGRGFYDRFCRKYHPRRPFKTYKYVHSGHEVHLLWATMTE
jgi:hypothetical protein